MPLLGVCLGHQGIGHVAGAPVVHAPEVMHGRMSAVYHDDSPLFAGIPQGFQVVRYHSLCVEEPLPAELEAIAWTSDGIVMGMAHRSRRGLGGAVPPGVDLHRLGPQAARELPRPDARALGPAHGRSPRRSVGAQHKWSPPQRPRAEPAGRAHRPGLRPRAGLREPLRRPPLRLLARQQHGRRALALLVHGRQRRPARLGDQLRRVDAARERRPRRLQRGPRGVDLRLPQPRDEAAALPLRRPAVRLQLRLRGLLRLRAEGRRRGRPAAPVDACRTRRSSSPTG